MEDDKRIDVVLYTIPEICEILGISRRTCMTYLQTGKLKGVKIGGKWKVSKENLQAYMQGN